jgi:SAM-dependent methyltransferase
MDCIVCGTTTAQGLLAWHATCPSCHYERADLKIGINDSSAHGHIDEGDRELALKALRDENFRAIVGQITRLAAPGAQRLLDIGCAHGWFLEHASGRFGVLGIEPDAVVGQATAARGLPVRLGFFPDALEPGEQFDVIVFNDVLEHIPNVQDAIQACADRLSPGGLLVLNLPSSRGLFYRLAKVLARFGWSDPFGRLWQKDLPSPHLHYFNERNLSTLVERHGFALLESVELPSLRANGLLQRLRYVGKVSKPKLYTQYLTILLAIPVLKFFPSDIVVCTYRKRAA